MRDSRFSAADGRLPADLRPTLDAYAQRGDWVGAITLLLTEGERRSDAGERVACYLTTARLYERKFANNAEAESVLEYVLGLSPDEPEAIQKLGELYARARRREKLRWLAEDRPRLGAQAPVPKPSRAPATAVGGAGGIPDKIGAAILFVTLPASVVAANMRTVTLVQRHDNAGGTLDSCEYTSCANPMLTKLIVSHCPAGRRSAMRAISRLPNTKPSDVSPS